MKLNKEIKANIDRFFANITADELYDLSVRKYGFVKDNSIEIMTGKEFNKEVKGVFKPLKREFYLGKIRYYTPYFEPTNYSSTILKVRKLIPLSKEVKEDYSKRGYGWAKKEWSNLPMCRRSKDWIIKLFGNSYWVQIGKPWAVETIHLGLKSKWGSPRYEWSPSFQIWFFGLQFCILWKAPTEDVDTYFEMALWYLFWADKNIEKAEASWDWVDGETKESTWNKNNLL